MGVIIPCYMVAWYYSKCQLLLPKVPAALFIIKGQDEFRFELSLSKKSQCKISFLADSMEGLSHFSLSTVVWPGTSMRPMVREVLCLNPGTGKKSVRI